MDPTNNPTLKQATELIRSGDRYKASVILAKFLKIYPDNEHAWHILSYALDDHKQQVYALERGITINPANKFIRQRLQKLAPKLISEPVTKKQSASSGLLQKVSTPGHQSVPPAPSAPSRTDPSQIRQSRPKQQPQVAEASLESPQITRQNLMHQSMPRVAVKDKLPAFETRQTARKFSLLQRFVTRLTINWRRFKLNWRIFSQSPLAIMGLILFLLFGLMAIAHPILMNTIWTRGIYDPATGFDINVFPHPSPPVTGHILGTDSLGRDVLSMILAATTPTFVVGLTAALTTAIIGTALSVTAAYFRGTVDVIITNTADVFLLFPAPVIMVIIGARFRDLTPLQLGLIYGFVTGAGGTTIVMRAQAIQVASKPFMEAAHIAGGGAWHIITKHLAPSVMPLAALQMMIAVTGAVVADGFISFFGLTRTVSNWGTIIYDAFIYGNISGDYGPPWHMLIPSAACFSLFALGFYLVSRGLHRVASPALREEY